MRLGLFSSALAGRPTCLKLIDSVKKQLEASATGSWRLAIGCYCARRRREEASRWQPLPAHRRAVAPSPAPAVIGELLASTIITATIMLISVPPRRNQAAMAVEVEQQPDESKGCCFVVEWWLYSIASMRTELEVDN